MLKGKKLLIFDCDGVLLDSLEANIAFFNYCLKLADHQPLSGEMLEKASYLSVKQLIYELIDDEIEAKRVYDISSEVKYDPFIEMLKPYFDFKSVLSLLKKDFFLAVASNRSKSLVKLFRYFDLFNYFQYKLSAIEARPKPDPDMIIKCIEYFAVKKDETLFFGDSISDYMAAKNAEVDYIWIGKDKKDPCIGTVDELLLYLNN